eukprot:SAG11_NODE_9520_length_903_cov_1.623134_1_plen_89_part_01
MTVSVVVPEGAGPGMQIMVDPDGPQGPLPPTPVTVRRQHYERPHLSSRIGFPCDADGALAAVAQIPEGVTAGMTIQVTIPAQAQAPAPM